MRATRGSKPENGGKEEGVNQNMPGAVMSAPYRRLSCGDLLSIHDLQPAEVADILELTAQIKARPADFRDALAGKQAVMFLKSRRCAPA